MDMNNGFTEEQNNELEVNRKNRENYENLMKESSTSLDGYLGKYRLERKE